jgi:hypothetical protein
MMKALHKGGIAAIYSEQIEAGNPDAFGYQPNPGGLYEVGFNQYMNADFLRRFMPDDSVIKIMFDGLPCLPQRKYKIIWMDRDPDEIKASTDRVDKHIIDASGGAVRPGSEAGKVTNVLPFCNFRPYCQEDIDHVLGICDARSDMHVIRVNFHDMISQPHHEFETLRLMGVPIDPEKAAAVIDSKLWRIRNEHGKSRSKERPSEGDDSASEAEDTRRAS